MTQTFPPALFPFESRFLPIDGHVVHYIDEGKGPTLLLFHGNPTSSFLRPEAVRGVVIGNSWAWPKSTRHCRAQPSV